MPVQRDLSLTIVPTDGDRLCAFLHNNENAGSYESEIPVPAGYFRANTKLDLLAAGDPARVLVLTTSVIRDYVVTERPAGLVVSRGTTSCPEFHPLYVDPYGELFIQAGVTAADEASIRAAFAGWAVGGNSRALEMALIRAGVDMDAYQVLLSYRLTKRGAPNEDDARHQAFLQAANDGGWDVAITERRSCKYPGPNPNVTPTVVEDIENPPDEVFGQLPEECGGQYLIKERLFDIPQLPGFRVVERDVDVTICGGKIGKVRIWVPQSRQQDTVFYAAVLLPASSKSLEKAIRRCFATSAIVTALKLIFLGGDWNTTRAAFLVSLEACLQASIPEEVMKCVTHDVVPVAEYKDWTDIF